MVQIELEIQRFMKLNWNKILLHDGISQYKVSFRYPSMEIGSDSALIEF